MSARDCMASAGAVRFGMGFRVLEWGEGGEEMEMDKGMAASAGRGGRRHQQRQRQRGPGRIYFFIRESLLAHFILRIE